MQAAADLRSIILEAYPTKRTVTSVKRKPTAHEACLAKAGLMVETGNAVEFRTI